MTALRTDLRGKSILVTGGSMGIGFETARLCASYGANVMICARGAEAVDQARAELVESATDSDIASAVCDVGDEPQVTDLFAAFSQRFGRCDGVIHAAGVYGPIGPIVDIEPAAWWEALRINLFGTFLVARAAATAMNASGGGRIALFSGGGASTPFPNYTAYASSKVAVVRFAETIAQELGPTIEVNCIAPGFVATRLHDQTLAAGAEAAGAFLEKTQAALASGAVPATVGAEAAAFLVSDAARGITGKFVAAPYDDYRAWPTRLEALEGSDLFTLRRIVPRERGLDWQ
jgi:3-oxoacyl-[acyl-carrier protein] reductase